MLEADESGVSVIAWTGFAQLRMHDQTMVATLSRLTIPMTEHKHTLHALPISRLEAQSRDGLS